MVNGDYKVVRHILDDEYNNKVSCNPHHFDTQPKRVGYLDLSNPFENCPRGAKEWSFVGDSNLHLLGTNIIHIPRMLMYNALALMHHVA